MTVSDDQLKQLIRTTDQAPADRPLLALRTPVAAMVEAVVSDEPFVRSRDPRHMWWPITLAAAVVIAAVAVVVTVTTRDDSSDTGNRRAKTVLQLALPASDGTSIGSCVPFSVQVLADMPVAFAATATDVSGEAITLDVDHWYRGGRADQVRLTAPDASRVSLQGAIDFSSGTRYLITATNGTLNYCGYSGKWSAALERRFQDAFNR